MRLSTLSLLVKGDMHIKLQRFADGSCRLVDLRANNRWKPILEGVDVVDLTLAGPSGASHEQALVLNAFSRDGEVGSCYCVV